MNVRNRALFILLLSVLATPLLAVEIRARTVDGRTVVLRPDRTWHYADETPARRRVNLASYSVPLSYEFLAEIAPWVLQDATVLYTLGLKLLVGATDIPDLVLHRLSPHPGSPEQTVIRLRIGDRATDAVGMDLRIP